METNFKLSWDARGYEKYKKFFDEDNRIDWNQTLITKINQLSAQIYQTSYMGGANMIKANKLVFESCLERLEYTKLTSDGYVLAGRYNIIIDDTVPNDKIYVYRDDEHLSKAENEGVVYCVRLNATSENEIGELTLSVHKKNSPELEEALKNENTKMITPELLTGEITLENI